MASFNTRSIETGFQLRPVDTVSADAQAAQIESAPSTGTSPESSHLKLRRPEDDGPRDTIPFERRTSIRRPICGHVTALRCEKRDDGMHNRICALTLVDASDLGLGAFCQEPVPEGSTITVFFPPHGPDRGFDAYGQVLRCESIDGQYRIGIQLVGRAAA